MQGFLRPDKGLIKSYSNKNGTIEKILVEQGDEVVKGTPLIQIVSHQNMESGEDLNKRSIEELSNQVNLLEEEQQQLFSSETKELTRLVQQQEILVTSKLIP